MTRHTIGNHVVVRAIACHRRLCALSPRHGYHMGTTRQRTTGMLRRNEGWTPPLPPSGHDQSTPT